MVYGFCLVEEVVQVADLLLSLKQSRTITRIFGDLLYVFTCIYMN